MSETGYKNCGVMIAHYPGRNRTNPGDHWIAKFCVNLPARDAPGIWVYTVHVLGAYGSTGKGVAVNSQRGNGRYLGHN